MLNTIGWRCAACGATRDIADPFPWRCAAATPDDRHHVLHAMRSLAPLRPDDHANPFVAYDRELAWAAFAEAHGMLAAARTALVESTDASVAAIAGTGFRRTPLRRSGRLSEALGFAPEGGVWIKDATVDVAGSHKARHLFTILLHLRAAELLGMLPERPRLAIASCGNAAIAAATLARAVDWAIDVFVPTWASDQVRVALDELGATTHTCERRAADPAGDPAVLRFREAVDAGAVPFSVQGPENALCLDGGRTLAWEIVEVLGHALDRIFVQVGGGALAASVGAAYAAAGVHPRLHAVQAEDVRRREGVDARRIDHIASGSLGRADDAVGIATVGGRRDPRRRDLRLDRRVRRDAARGGSPVVASEAQIAEAHRMATGVGYAVSVTGSAGLAGLLAIREEIDPGERVAVVMSGIAR